MTLRLGLLIVSLVLLGVMALLCHYKYRQQKAAKRRTSRLPRILEDEINTPYFTERATQENEILLNPVQNLGIDIDAEPVLEVSVENKRAYQKLARQLLPVYGDKQLIIDYVALLPGPCVSAKRLRDIIASSTAKPSKSLVTSAQACRGDVFKRLSDFTDDQLLSHISLQMQLKDKRGPADEATLNCFEVLVSDVGEKLGREFYYAINSQQALDAALQLDKFIHSNDLIIILYILAQPNQRFNGSVINRVLVEEGLNYGEFKFFHYFQQGNQEKKIYTLTNLYKPGSFEVDELDQLSTTGLCAYMLPALQVQPLNSLKIMVETLANIAEKLNGVLTTNRREIVAQENYLELSRQINKQLENLKARGIMPASDLAKRLFE